MVTLRDSFINSGFSNASSAKILVAYMNVVSLDIASILICFTTLRSSAESVIFTSGGWPGPVWSNDGPVMLAYDVRLNSIVSFPVSCSLKSVNSLTFITSTTSENVKRSSPESRSMSNSISSGGVVSAVNPLAGLVVFIPSNSGVITLPTISFTVSLRNRKVSLMFDAIFLINLS